MSMSVKAFVHSRTGAVIVGARILVTIGGVGSAVALNRKLNTGRLKGLESDGPYPGLPVLQQGDDSRKTWIGGAGATLQRSWVQCSPGKTAIGGGLSPGDEAFSTMHDFQIVTSRPAQFQGGEEVGVAIPGDPDSSIVPNAWLVEGFDNGASGTIVVRPWVVCATISD
ncbi:MAG: hypothetical protein WAN48_14580 [Actinomycetes bacterium]